jgi:hypothetical protein
MRSVWLALMHWAGSCRLIPPWTPKGGYSEKPSTSGEKDSNETAAVTANLAKLSEEDRQLAEVQKLCPISGEPLGAMGVPLKLTSKDQPVFLCCKGCQTEALADAEKTLAKVNELKKKTASPM